MPKNLVIVESPAKAKTIEKYLGKDYKVMASQGHIRDLHKSDFSIDVAHGYMPIYEIPDDKKRTVADLKKATKSAEMVWLASDEDREGEAIAWHLYEVLGLKPDTTRRIVFHEITKTAILDAIQNPRNIDINLVNAQQARRVLDRIVGFELSPVLWRKIKPGLSAGRVQSVAVRLIADREKEIADFKSEPYFRVTGTMKPEGSEASLAVELSRRLDSREDAISFLEACKHSTFTVSDVAMRPITKCPAPPFTTSTLQQEAARKLGFSVAQTMRVAQALYEAGHITYMRTDSVNLSQLALSTIAKEVNEMYGANHYKRRQFTTKARGAQEAHEAIRPTFVADHDIQGTPQEKKLYQLIWKRTVASQMADAQIEKTTIDIAISNRPEHFTASGEVVTFPGFMKVYAESIDDEPSAKATSSLPALNVGAHIHATAIEATQRFTQQPVRYTEASLVRRMEELGIGRPSTYAPTISTIQQRNYVEKGESKGETRECEIITLKGANITSKLKNELAGAEKGKLLPTDVGMVVNDFLIEYFPNIIDYNFTAKVENEFDDVAEGAMQWTDAIDKFYTSFHPNVENVSHLRLDRKVGERLLGTDPKSGKPVSVKITRFGPAVQLGNTGENGEKPRFASLRADQSMQTITLEEALMLFELPRTLGQFEGSDVVASIGRFGPYVRHAGKFVSIPKNLTAETISLEEAIEIIENNRKTEEQRVIATFSEEPELQVLNGRFGPYISYKKANYKIPKDKDAKALNLQDCLAIVADEANASKASARRATTKKAPRRPTKKSTK
ncbi:MAG: type I DNA topoisomerase [Muribaculaceae bacterium]|nr:type I DNA topoisomerase [Muribaculaceae bacterium]